MTQATMTPIDQARAIRDKARRARRLAEDLNAEDVAGRMRDYAEQLETTARQYEECAGAASSD